MFPAADTEAFGGDASSGAAALSPAALTELRTVANELADAARRAAAPHFRADALTLENKASQGFDPVTVADRAIETEMRAILAERRPRDGIVGEEFGVTPSESGLTWVLDPIDGTRSFMAGIPLWGVLIALFDGERPCLGVIDQPYLEERFIGVSTAEDRHAVLQRREGEKALKTRSCTDLSQATLFTTTPALFVAGAERAAYDAVEARARLTRYGADCYAYAMVAAGQADLVVEAGLASYDIQAPIALVEAAGGVATDWRGGPAHGGGRVIAAGDPRVHAQALEILADA